MSPKRRKRRVAKAAEAAVSLKRGRPLRQSEGGLGVPKVVEVRGLQCFWIWASAVLGTPGLPPLWGRGLRGFRDTGASAALRTRGPQLLWGHRGLRRFGDTGASATLGHRPLQLLGKPGPLALWGHGLEMSNCHTLTRSEEAYILDHPPRHWCKRHQEEPHQHAEPVGIHGHWYRSPPPPVQVISTE